VTFTLCLQAIEGLVLITDSRIVDTSTQGYYRDKNVKLYQLTDYCGMVVNGYPHRFRTFLIKILDKISPTDDLNHIEDKIKNIIFKEKDELEKEFGKLSSNDKVFKNLNRAFQVTLCGFYRANEGLIPKISFMELSLRTYPFLFPFEDFTRYKYGNQIIGPGYVISGVQETEIEDIIKDTYFKIYLPPLEKIEKLAIECLEGMKNRYCTVGGDIQMAKITVNNGFKWINKPKWMDVN
jgi:hypothetical protein